MSELDANTKARIEAEERYRQELRAQVQANPNSAPVPPQQVTPAVPPQKMKKKAGCGTWLAYGVGALILLGVLGNLTGGNKSTTTISNPATTSTAPGSNSPTPQDSSTPSPGASNGEGEVQADGSQNVGVWNVSTQSWNRTKNVGGEYGESAGDGETFIIVNYTVKNNTNESQDFSTMIDQPKLILSDGSIIDEDKMLTIQADKNGIDGQIALA